MCRIPAGPHHSTPLYRKFTKHPPRNAPNLCCIEFYCSSYCLYHRPTQSVNLIESSGQTCPICLCEIDWNSRTSLAEVPLKTPCCRNSWFHNSCLQVINTVNLNEINLKSVRLPMDWVVDSNLWPKHEPHVSLQMGKRFLSYDVDISLLTLSGFSWFDAPLLLSCGSLQSQQRDKNFVYFAVVVRSVLKSLVL